jgi:hypothetical protein
VALRRVERAHRKHRRLDHEVRTQLHDIAVLDRAGLTFVGVHDDVPRPGLARHGLPLQAGGETGAAVSRQPRRLELLDDRLERRKRAEELESAAPLVVRERRVAAAERDRRPFVGRVRDLRDDLVAAGHRRREVAVAEAGDLERTRRRLEQLARSEAVADGAGADANGIGGYLQERVERDDLVHLAAPNVHVVGDRVGEVHRDRPDFAADAAEVVEQPGSLARKLGQ